MIRPPRIYFVNRFYWPDEPATAQLLTDLAEALAAEGRAVSVITSQPTGNLPAFHLRNGVEILRVKSRRGAGRGLIAKALAYEAFARGALRLLNQHLQAGDVLVVMTDPPLLGARATASALKRGARVVHWVQDVFPEVTSAVGLIPAARLFRWWRDRAWTRADACVALGREMAALLRARGVLPERIILCPNWAPRGIQPLPPGAAVRLRDHWGLQRKFVIVYSGNLGRVHDLLPVLALAKELQKEPDFVVVFIGEGAQKAKLERQAGALGLGNVLFKPAQARTQLNEALALGDVHLITLRPGCEALVFPSKLYGIAAAGRPALFIGPPHCELARILARHRFGAAFSRNEMDKAAGLIRELRSNEPARTRLSRAAIAYWHEYAQLEHALPCWRALLDSLMPLATSRSLQPE